MLPWEWAEQLNRFVKLREPSEHKCMCFAIRRLYSSPGIGERGEPLPNFVRQISLK